MDLASVFGLVGGIAVILITILLSGDLIGYVDIPSIICTFGGTIAMTFMAFPIKKLKEGFAALKYVFVYKETDCLLYTSPSPRDRTRTRMPSSA